MIHIHGSGRHTSACCQHLDCCWGSVDSHKHTDIEVHTEGHDGHNVALVSVGVALQHESALCGTTPEHERFYCATIHGEHNAALIPVGVAPQHGTALLGTALEQKLRILQTVLIVM